MIHDAKLVRLDLSEKWSVQVVHSFFMSVRNPGMTASCACAICARHRVFEKIFVSMKWVSFPLVFEKVPITLVMFPYYFGQLSLVFWQLSRHLRQVSGRLGAEPF